MNAGCTGTNGHGTVCTIDRPVWLRFWFASVRTLAIFAVAITLYSTSKMTRWLNPMDALGRRRHRVRFLDATLLSDCRDWTSRCGRSDDQPMTGWRFGAWGHCGTS